MRIKIPCWPSLLGFVAALLAAGCAGSGYAPYSSQRDPVGCCIRPNN